MKEVTNSVNKFRKIFGFPPKFSMGGLDVLWLNDVMEREEGYKTGALSEFVRERYGEEAERVCQTLIESRISF